MQWINLECFEPGLSYQVVNAKISLRDEPEEEDEEEDDEPHDDEDDGDGDEGYSE